MSRKNELLEQLSNEGKVYELKVENMYVEMRYSKNNTKIDECVLNVLKRKNK